MKYTFINKSGNSQTVEIQDDWIAKQMKLLHITKREAAEMWLSDEGYIDNEVVEELTQQAKTNGSGVKGASTKPRKKPERKPDYTKRELIDFLYETLADHDLDLECGTLKDVEKVNIERIITFAIKDDRYELTLSKKRKPKD